MRMGMGLGIKPSQAISFSNKYYLNFDGTDDRVVLSSVNAGTDSMVSFWIKRGNPNSSEYVFGEDSYQSDYFIQFMYMGFPLFLKEFNIRIGNTEVNYGDAYIDDTNWHHIVIVRNGDDIDVYKDGAFAETGSGFGAVVDTKTDTFGSKPAGVNPFEGYLDEIAMYNESPAKYVDTVPGEITTLYGDGTPETCGDMTKVSGLLAGWRCEEGTGTTAADIKGNNDGTLTNGVSWGIY